MSDVLAARQEAHERAVASALHEALAGAREHPGRSVTGYSDADRRVLAEQAARLRRRADRLDAGEVPTL